MPDPQTVPSGPARAARRERRPVLELLTSHWLTLVGLGLITTAIITWLLVLPAELRGAPTNPYLGIVVFLVIPAVFFSGLALVPIGIFLGRRRVKRLLVTEVFDRRRAVRQLLIFLAVTTGLNLVIGTQLTYRAVEHMESVQFCGQTCHVMKPEFVAHQNSPHARIACVQCHVTPGFGGWVESKMNGTRQLTEVMFNTYPRPIPSALETGRLVPTKGTCEQCHWPEQFASVRLRLIPHFADDEANTPTATVLTMMIGGSITKGIHGAHFAAGATIRYRTEDGARQTIPWVQYENPRTGESRIYLATDSTPESVKDLPTYTMQCVDCHNRPTHAFTLPEKGVDRALMFGALPSTLPFIRKKAVELLKTEYPSTQEATRAIPAGLEEFYKQTQPTVYAQRAVDIRKAGQFLAELYNRNVFPDLKVTWGTYPNNLGHNDSPGCFRCHDGSHTAADGQTITQDCTACHQPVAIDEASPEVLATLGLTERLKALQTP